MKLVGRGRSDGCIGVVIEHVSFSPLIKLFFTSMDYCQWQDGWDGIVVERGYRTSYDLGVLDSIC